MNKAWYSVRCVFQHESRPDMTLKNLFEERITIWKASSFDEAVAMAERESQSYAKDTDCRYVVLAQAFELFSGSIRSGAEVFSLMRESNYSAKKYLDAFFDTGKERQERVDNKNC